MKTIIAGSRTITDPRVITWAVNRAVRDADIWPSEIVEGEARGVDTLALKYAFDQGIPVRRMPADWERHGKAAGVIRNKLMAEYAEALIAIWDGQSKGTKHMIEEATRRGLKVYVFKYATSTQHISEHMGQQRKH